MRSWKAFGEFAGGVGLLAVGQGATLLLLVLSHLRGKPKCRACTQAAIEDRVWQRP